MLQSGVNIMQSAAADLSFYDKSISAAKVILTGFTVVFAMLFFLIIIIKVYSNEEKRKNIGACRRGQRSSHHQKARIYHAADC